MKKDCEEIYQKKIKGKYIQKSGIEGLQTVTNGDNIPKT